MSALCDLHTHTTASDGQYAPAELVRLAKTAACPSWRRQIMTPSPGLRRPSGPGRNWV